MKVENGHNVKVHYKGTFTDGTEFDNSRTRGETLNFEVGTPGLIKGFNNAVVGMAAGETKTIKLAADEAYGQPNPEAFQRIPKARFDNDFVFEVGGMVGGNSPRGPVRAIIREIHENAVVLDFNHPLAGKDLIFELEVVSVQGDELAQTTDWNTKMKKAELLEIARNQGLGVNTRSTKKEIIAALQA